MLRHLDIDRARAEMLSLLENAQPDGFIAHVTFWQRERHEDLLKNYCIAYRTPYLSDCIQPPLLAEAVFELAASGAGDAFLRAVLPRVRRYYDWLDRFRDPDRDGLIAVLLPDETGLDHTPKFDGYLGIPEGRVTLEEFDAAWASVASAYAAASRDPAAMVALDRFLVEDVMVNSIYGRSQRLLARLLESIGDSAGAAALHARADRTTASLIAKCRDPETGLFFDLAGRDERPLPPCTFTSLFPLILEDLPPPLARPLIEKLCDPRHYAAPFPVPTVSMSEPTFAARPVGTRLLWRGPAWMNVNWFLWGGLRRHGEAELAARIAGQSARMVRAHGFREYYDPLTGEGFGAEAFSWSGLVLDMLERAD